MGSMMPPPVTVVLLELALQGLKVLQTVDVVFAPVDVLGSDLGISAAVTVERCRSTDEKAGHYRYPQDDGYEPIPLLLSPQLILLCLRNYPTGAAYLTTGKPLPSASLGDPAGKLTPPDHPRGLPPAEFSPKSAEGFYVP
jgi:hypothetical protein